MVEGILLFLTAAKPRRLLLLEMMGRGRENRERTEKRERKERES